MERLLKIVLGIGLISLVGIVIIAIYSSFSQTEVSIYTILIVITLSISSLVCLVIGLCVASDKYYF